MRALLPYYESELTFLRRRGQSFAQAYPRLAGQLQLGADEAKDPHVERMIEAFALLTARVNKRLDDDFPLFTESLLEVLYPHYLRPFPSASIAQFDLGATAGQLSKMVTIERGSVLYSRPVKGVPCRFRTSQAAQLWPMRVTEAQFKHAVAAPEGTRLPVGATSVLSLTLEWTSSQVTWLSLKDQPLRFYLDGEPSLVSALREALCSKALGVMVQTRMHQPWRTWPDDSVTSPTTRGTRRPARVGFEDDEALIDFDSRSHPAYRLLTEYFAFSEKFNFVDIPVPVASIEGAPSQVIVHIPMAGVRAGSDEGRLLEAVHARNLLLGCTPVVNLFQQPADPIRVTHTKSAYPVLVDGRRAFGYEVYAIDKVFRVKQTLQGEQVELFKPFFSLQHDDVLQMTEAQGSPEDSAATMTGRREPGSGISPGTSGRYWVTHRDEDVAQESPGYELELSIVDVDFDPAVPQTETLSLTVTATNRDLPTQIPFGAVGGDLFMEGGGPAREIRLLRKPTPSQRFDRGRGAVWRLISHLSLNHLSLSGGGIDALKEMMRLYDLPRSASNQRQIEGMKAVSFQPATAWLPGEPFATFVRGTEVRLTVDEESFVGSGLGLFAALLERFFGLYVHANSFSRLVLISERSKEEVLTCPPRNGDMTLL
jgi:type VI secretion system protein ImpG